VASFADAHDRIFDPVDLRAALHHELRRKQGEDQYFFLYTVDHKVKYIVPVGKCHVCPDGQNSDCFLVEMDKPLLPPASSSPAAASSLCAADVLSHGIQTAYNLMLFGQQLSSVFYFI
jgi:hypothetical protein